MSATPPLVEIDEYQVTVSLLWGWARLIEDMPIEDALSRAKHAETVGPFIDPTAFREKHQALREDIRLLRAFAAVKAELAVIKEQHR